MSVKDWKSFEYWRSYCGDKQVTPDERVSNEPLTSNTVFLWFRQTAPLPTPIEVRFWQDVPEPKAIAGYLRFVVLPMFFGIWLCRNQWDPDPKTFVSAEDIFAGAEQVGKSDYAEDLPLMRSLVAQLDALFEVSDDQVTEGLKRIAQEFNQRWEKTPTWQCKIQVFDSPTEVGEEVIRWREEWLREPEEERLEDVKGAGWTEEWLEDVKGAGWTEEELEQLGGMGLPKEELEQFEGMGRTEEELEEERREFELWKSEWRQICANALLDKESQDQFFGGLAEWCQV